MALSAFTPYTESCRVVLTTLAGPGRGCLPLPGPNVVAWPRRLRPRHPYDPPVSPPTHPLPRPPVGGLTHVPWTREAVRARRPLPHQRLTAEGSPVPALDQREPAPHPPVIRPDPRLVIHPLDRPRRHLAAPVDHDLQLPAGRDHPQLRQPRPHPHLQRP